MTSIVWTQVCSAHRCPLQASGGAKPGVLELARSPGLAQRRTFPEKKFLGERENWPRIKDGKSVEGDGLIGQIGGNRRDHAALHQRTRDRANA